jgi:hypothetical protein
LRSSISTFTNYITRLEWQIIILNQMDAEQSSTTLSKPSFGHQLLPLCIHSLWPRSKPVWVQVTCNRPSGKSSSESDPLRYFETQPTQLDGFISEGWFTKDNELRSSERATT